MDNWEERFRIASKQIDALTEQKVELARERSALFSRVRELEERLEDPFEEDLGECLKGAAEVTRKLTQLLETYQEEVRR